MLRPYRPRTTNKAAMASGSNEVKLPNTAAQTIEVVQGVPVVTDWASYRVLAGFTESIPAKWSADSSANLRLVHYALGIISELDELIDGATGAVAPNYAEEVGDLQWYLALAESLAMNNTVVVEEANLLTMTAKVEELLKVKSHSQLAVLLRDARIIFTDSIKRWLAYGDGSAPAIQMAALIGAMQEIVSLAIAYVCNQRGLAVEDVISLEVLQANIAKLSTRYPEGFEIERAYHRSLTAEAQALNRLGTKQLHRVGDQPVPEPIAYNLTDAVESALDAQARPLSKGSVGKGCTSC